MLRLGKVRKERCGFFAREEEGSVAAGKGKGACSMSCRCASTGRSFRCVFIDRRGLSCIPFERTNVSRETLRSFVFGASPEGRAAPTCVTPPHLPSRPHCPSCSHPCSPARCRPRCPSCSPARSHPCSPSCSPTRSHLCSHPCSHLSSCVSPVSRGRGLKGE